MLHVFCWQWQVNCFHPERVLFHLCYSWASDALFNNQGFSCNRRCTDMHVCNHSLSSKEHAFWCDYAEMVQKTEHCSQISLKVAISTHVSWLFSYCCSAFSMLLKCLTVSNLQNTVTWLWNFSFCCNCKSLCQFKKKSFFFRKVGKIKWKLSCPSVAAT